jgi:hypothetical protein
MVLGLVAGCGGSSELAAVQGHVRYRGQPLTGGVIIFVPDIERGGRGPLAIAELGAEGQFELRTEGKPGCRPGWHRVTVAVSSSHQQVPAHYRDPELSGQRVEVRSGVTNHCDIRLD